MSVVLREKKTAHAAVLRRRGALSFPVWLHAAAAAAGWAGARAGIFGSMQPFGLCLTACAPRTVFFSVFAGAAAGYFSASSPSCAAFLAGTLLCALLRGLVFAVRCKMPALLPSAAGCAAAGLLRAVFFLADGSGPAGIAHAAAESAFALGMCVLLSGFFAMPQPLSPSGKEEKAFALAAVYTAVICLSPYTFFELSPAVIAAGAGALYLARRSSDQAAAAAVCACAALCAADSFYLYAGFALCCGAVAAGLFSHARRGGTALCFLAAGASGVWCAPDPDARIVLMIELIFSAGIFLLFCPDSLSVHSSENTSSGTARPAQTALSAQLCEVSEALCSVGETMRAVYRCIPMRRPSPSELADEVAERCCRSCPKRLYCWVDCADETYREFAMFSSPLPTDGIRPAELPTLLARRCQTPVRLTNAINSVLAENSARRLLFAESRRTREALCAQYSAFAELLGEFAQQVYSTNLPDRRRAQKLEALFSASGLEVTESSVTLDAAGHISASVLLSEPVLPPAELARIAKEVSALFRCNFSPVKCTHLGTAARLSFAQRPVFRAEAAACSLAAEEEVCADSVQQFTDTAHRFCTVLCDGMGTGKAAAVGGTLTACLMKKLISAGFGAQNAAHLVNAALTLKSDDESAVALDAFTLDLCSGEAQLYKAGGAASFLIHCGNVRVLDGDTLPIGILGDVTDSCTSLQLSEGDLLILVSDGALAAGTQDFCRTAAKLCDEPVDAFCRMAANAARAACDARPDDITVTAVRLCRQHPDG